VYPFSKLRGKEIIFMSFKLQRSIAFFVMAIGLLTALSGCYQAHSDDDLRTVPVTNNPNLVPGDGMSRFTAINP
jgi:hypothetical protein